MLPYRDGLLKKEDSSYMDSSYTSVNTINFQQDFHYISFKDRFPKEIRKKWVDEAFVKFPSKIPVIIERGSGAIKRRGFTWSSPQ